MAGDKVKTVDHALYCRRCQATRSGPTPDQSQAAKDLAAGFGGDVNEHLKALMEERKD